MKTNTVYMRYAYLLIFFVSQQAIALKPKAHKSENLTLGLNFTSVTAANCRSSVEAAPQNPTGAVGSTQYIVHSYQAFRSFNKKTGQPDGALDVDVATFYGFPLADPYLLYDRFSQRWFSSGEQFNPTIGVSPFELNIAMSSSSTITPATSWTFYTVPAAQINPFGYVGGFIDYQQPATDQNAYYNAVGTYDSLGNFLGSSLTVIPKDSLLGGTPNITVFPQLFPQVIGRVEEGFAAPANNFDCDPQYGYLVWCIYTPPASNTGNTIQLYRILNAGTNTPSLGPIVTINLAQTFAWNGLFNDHKGNLYGAPGYLQNGFGRLATPHVRNKQLYIAQDIQVDNTGAANINGDRIGVRWYQFDLTGDSTGRGLGNETPGTTPVLIQSGTLFDDSPSNPLSYYLASIMTNKQADLIVSFNTSGKDAFVNTGYAFRSASDPLNALRTPVQVTNTQFPLNFQVNESLSPGPACQRWGDESAAVVDPCDDRTFWLTQPFAERQNAWGIQSTQVNPVH